MPVDKVTVRAYAASIIIEAEAEYDDEASANTAAQELDAMTPEAQTQALGVPVEPNASPVVTAEPLTGEEEAKSSSMTMYAAIAAVVVLLMVHRVLLEEEEGQGRRHPKKEGRQGRQAEQQQEPVRQCGDVGSKPPPGPMHGDSSFLMDEEKLDSFITGAPPGSPKPPGPAPPSGPPPPGPPPPAGRGSQRSPQSRRQKSHRDRRRSRRRRSRP